MTIAVTTHYFAVFRERAGRDSEIVTTSSSTARELYTEIAGRHDFADGHERCKVAINGALSTWDAAIKSGDEILFFPPVAGG